MERITSKEFLGDYDINTLCAGCEALEKLSLYEDTGLTPEEVAAWAKAYSEGRMIIIPQGIVGGAIRTHALKWEAAEAAKGE